MNISPMNIYPVSAYSSSFDAGMFGSIRAMTADMKHMEILTQNVSKSGLPGFQANRVVRRPFAEVLGVASVETMKDKRVGRLRQTGVGEDFALATEGYFQLLDPKTGRITLTRDGRSQISIEGYMTSQNGLHFLDASGNPIKLPEKPMDAGKQLKIDEDGSITFRSDVSGKYQAFGRLGVVTEAGQRPDKVDVVQMHTEDGNVMIQEEFMEMVPTRRFFEANSQIFKVQSESLQRMLQELGRAQ
jgi:flagellar basal body rod protein FlgG